MSNLPKKKHKVLWITLTIVGVLLLIVAAGAIYVVHTLLNSPVLEPISASEDQWTMPTTSYDIHKAVQHHQAFLLPYDNNGTFTIMQLTDAHLRRGPGNGNTCVYRLLSEAFAIKKPNLLIATGDLVFSLDGKAMLKEFAQFMEEQQVYWGYVFGNHDGEYTHTRKELASVLEQFPHALFSTGPDWVFGESDYVIGLIDSQGEVRQALMLLDSHDARMYEIDGKMVEGYDYIYPSQIAWYEWVSQGLDATSGVSVPLFAFFHIPLPEYQTAFDNQEILVGTQREKSCAPFENTGLFDTMVADGDTIATFSGHDHINDFTAKLDGIWLSYGRSASWGSYGEKGFAKGVRYITLNEHDPTTFELETLTTEDLHW